MAIGKGTRARVGPYAAMALALLLAAGPLLAAQRFERGLLWQVELDGAVRGYVFGTIHLADPRVAAIRPGVADALIASAAVVTELAMEPENLRKAAAGLMLPEGERLRALLGDETFAALLPRLAARGVDAATADRMKPYAALTLLLQPEGGGQLPLDLTIYLNGRQLGKRVGGLETVEEQLAVFETLTLADQTRMLRALLERPDEAQRYVEQLVTAYLDEDLAAMEALMDSGMPLGPEREDLQQAFNDAFLYQRNALMAERMDAAFRREKTFVAVGALHLAGERGVLRELERRGFRVTRRPL
jgi:uncharacterized protein YbaP (TraB family)